MTRCIATPDAKAYAPSVYHGERHPNSLAVTVAPRNAHAECPDGNDRMSLPSGRGYLLLRFIDSTVPAMITVPMAWETAITPHDERVDTPNAFIIQGNASGAYWAASANPVPGSLL